MAIESGLAYWASVRNPNLKFEPVYTVDLVVDEEVAKKYESKGYKVKTLVVNDEVVGKALTIKRKVNGPDGMIRKAPKLVDAKKNVLDDDVLVGNGSKVRVQFSEWEVSNKYGNFKGLDFQGLQVIDLVSYKGADGEEFDAVGEDSVEEF
tara:strand:- start:6406 stop:6855 length:450 start_codon:yes stop_codon:yes gene_type:complete